MDHQRLNINISKKLLFFLCFIFTMYVSSATDVRNEPFNVMSLNDTIKNTYFDTSLIKKEHDSQSLKKLNALITPFLKKNTTNALDNEKLFSLNERKIKEIEKELINKLDKNSSDIGTKLKSIIGDFEANKIRLSFIPVYTLSLNVFNIKRIENISEYFIIDTTVRMFCISIIGDKKDVGFLLYNSNGGLSLRPNTSDDSINYALLKKLNKKPIAIRTEPFGGIRFFGYIEKKYLFISISHDELQNRTDFNTKKTSTTYVIEEKIIDANNYYFATSGNNSLSNFQIMLNNTLNTLEYFESKKK